MEPGPGLTGFRREQREAGRQDRHTLDVDPCETFVPEAAWKAHGCVMRGRHGQAPAEWRAHVPVWMPPSPP